MIKKSQLILIFSIIFIFAGNVFAQLPILFYSDLTSGPKTGGYNDKGCFVTIWGKNFGNNQGTSYVQVGSGKADNYPTWEDTKICFQLGEIATSGEIKVFTNYGFSNGLSFNIRPGNIYFVDDSSTNIPGTGTYQDPWRSPADYVAKLNNGEDGSILYFRQGTYCGQFGYPGWYSTFCLKPEHSGALNKENAFVAFPNEQPLINATDTPFRHAIRASSPDVQHIIISKLKCNSINGTIIPGSNWRIIGNYLKGIQTPSASGIVSTNGNNIKIYGNEITGGASGDKLDHAIYPGYGSDNVDIGWNHIYNNNFSLGPMISVNNNRAYDLEMKFENIRIHDNIIDVTSYPSRAIGIYETGSGSTIYIYNNLILGHSPDNNATCYAISGNVYFYNNTIYNGGSKNGGSVLHYYSATVYSHLYEPEIIEIKNNILYANSNSSYYIKTAGTAPMPVISHNLFYGIGLNSGNVGAGQGYNAINNLEPNFNNILTKNFDLKENSPCINRGTSDLLNSIVMQDINGVARPINDQYDIGAYEFEPISPPLNLEILQ